MLTEISLQALELICFRLRDCDKREVYALRPHDNWYRLTYEIHAHIQASGRGIIAWHKGRPAGLAAFTELRPGTWEAWMIGTDDFTAVVFELVRWARRTANEILTTSEGHRCQCDSRADHHEAHKLLLALGAKPEGPPMRNFGKDKSSYQRFVWLRDEDGAVLQPGFVRADRGEQKMCLGSKSSSNTTPPAPQQPTTFDYSAGQRSQMAADGSVSRAQAAKQVSTTDPLGQAQLGAPTGGA